MSKIDLNRLIVKQKYFIPIKASKLKDTILKELKATEEEINGIYPWYLAEEHKNSFVYEYSLKYHFVQHQVMRIKKRKTKKFKMSVKQKSAEYKESLPKSYHEQLKRVISSLPITIYVFIINAEDKGCICDVECLPILYEKLNMKVVEEATEFEIQTAYLGSKRFLKNIFECGLSATFVTEEIKKVEKPTVQFLINDVSTRKITERIEAMLNGATGEILIFAWMGTILLKKLRELKEKGVKIRVITGNPKGLRQDVMRKEKERAFKELIQIVGKDHISIKPEFHGRAIIVDNKSLTGSMDLDSYSLTGTRIEFATYTEDPETVRNLRNYFNRIFSPLSKEKTK